MQMDVQTSDKIRIADLNPILTCILCDGYFIDATTISECLHSFCKTCIVKFLETNKYCPICEVVVHKTKPLLSIRSDQTLQDIVYKVVPGLFHNEMMRRIEFCAKQNIKGEKQDVSTCERLIFTPDDIISISLEYYSANLMFPIMLPSENGCSFEGAINDVIPRKGAINDVIPRKVHRRYFQCPGAVTVCHLKKLLRTKYNLKDDQEIDIMFMHDQLRDEYTLIDLAYIYSWRRNGPLRLFYKFRNGNLDLDFMEEEHSDMKEHVVPPTNCCNVSDTSPGPSVGAAPSSQPLWQHASPPLSPQLAAEPLATTATKPKSAAMQNNQLDSHTVDSADAAMASENTVSKARMLNGMPDLNSINVLNSRKRSANLACNDKVKPSRTRLKPLDSYKDEKTARSCLKNGFKSEISRSENKSHSLCKSGISNFQRKKSSVDFFHSVPNKSCVPRLSQKATL